jgi:predicted DNA-binding transcriptional regulator AlpA
MKKDLIPQKRVAAKLGVSRCTLWRAVRSNIPGFPPPQKIRSRVFWREAELPTLKEAMERFGGRGAFEVVRRHAKARSALIQAATACKAPHKRGARRSLPQPDLFGETDAAGPSGAEAINGRRYRDPNL